MTNFGRRYWAAVEAHRLDVEFRWQIVVGAALRQARWPLRRLLLTLRRAAHRRRKRSLRGMLRIWLAVVRSIARRQQQGQGRLNR